MSATPEHRAFVEAGVGIVMSIIMADGKYAEEEFVWFKTAQNRHPLFRDVPPDAFNDILRRVRGRLSGEPWQVLVNEWANSVPAQHRVSIYELAAELAVSDHGLEGKEPEVVRYLGRALDIPDELARKIFMGHIERM